ncbi:MAG: polyhydroxyalkanoic acid system family protein [Polyangiaceae bacterium]
MATIDIAKSHTLSLEDAKKKAEDLAKGMETKLGISWKWTGDTIAFEASSGAAKGTKGTVAVTANEVKVAIDLPFMLKMMKGTIEEKVREKLADIS